jgi:cbb3-type cytochrome oxidase subunit 3
MKEIILILFTLLFYAMVAYLERDKDTKKDIT